MVERLRVFDFHGLRLGLAASEAVATALDTRFARFTRLPVGPCDVHFDYRNDADTRAPPPDDGRVIYESTMGQVLYSDKTDRLWISSVWPIHAQCDPRSGTTTICVEGPEQPHVWALSHPLLTIPLIEILKRRARFSLHAAAVAVGGKGLLIPGSSGSGKSTLALALARAGFGFLGDDMLFLSQSNEGLSAQGFPEAVDLTDQTAQLFPDLRDLLERGRLPGWPKHQLRVEERFGTEIVWQCRPVALVFPRVASFEQSKLSPMSRDEALFEILPNILLSESSSCQQHLDALSQLVASCACYRLETGRDFERLAAMFRGLIESEA